MALPTRLSGLGLDNPQSKSESEYSASRNVCLPITDLIIQQSGQLNPDTLEKQRQARSVVRQERRQAAAKNTRTLGCSWKSSLMTPNDWSTWLLKRVHPTGWRSCRWMSMAFTCTRQHSGMLSVCGLIGSLIDCLRSVYVEAVSQWTRPDLQSWRIQLPETQ